MTAPYEVRSITSVSELLDGLKALYPVDAVVWYRGQSEAKWSLLPSLARKKALADEKALQAQFQRDAVPMLSKAQIPGTLETPWDWMFLMQHYGVPTRLLDWSESPLTALWFAVQDHTKDDKDGALWALQPQLLNSYRSIYPDKPWDIPLCGSDPETDDYTTDGLNDGSPSRSLTPLAVIAERRFDRVIAQQGVFTVVHKDLTPLEDIKDSKHIAKFEIPAASRADVRDDLTRIGVTEMSLFPDLGRLGAMIARRLP